MYRRRSTACLPVLVAGLTACTTSIVWAQAPIPIAAPEVVAPSSASGISLKDLFSLAWERQPEARASEARRQAATAAKEAAARFTAEPAALELQSKTGGSGGGREYEAAVALPLWLPGERSRSSELADAELRATGSRVLAAQLRVAATVREAWWALARTRVDLGAAQDRLRSADQLAADVARRVRAGDLSRADQHQAEAAAAQAEAAVAEASSARIAAVAALRGLAPGLQLPQDAHAAAPEPLPTGADPVQAIDSHPALAELRDRALVARRTAQLASVQTRPNPELTVGATREGGEAGAGYRQAFVIGVRIPFGGGPRAEVRRAGAHADALEVEAQAGLERNRVAAEAQSARARLDAAQVQLAAAHKRARLAAESRGFYDKSFRLGESDLPTRLRVELEAAEAQRALARSQIEAAAAVSQLRQSLGLLPE